MLFYDPILTGIDCTDLRLSVVFKIDERLLQKVLVKKKNLRPLNETENEFLLDQSRP